MSVSEYIKDAIVRDVKNAFKLLCKYELVKVDEPEQALSDGYLYSNAYIDTHGDGLVRLGLQVEHGYSPADKDVFLKGIYTDLRKNCWLKEDISDTFHDLLRIRPHENMMNVLVAK